MRLNVNHPSLRLLAWNVAGNLARLGSDPAMARFLNTADIIAFSHTGNPVNNVAPVISPELTCLRFVVTHMLLDTGVWQYILSTG